MVSQDDLDGCLARATGFFARTCLPDDHAWPDRLSTSIPSTWGGTSDAIRALAVLGLRDSTPPGYMREFSELDLDRAASWLSRQVDPDTGAFNSHEFGYAGAESTAWVLIGLREYTDRRDPVINRALSYLETCINIYGGVGTVPNDRPRTFPTALTLWAFAAWRHAKERQSDLIQNLLRCQDAESKGWGVDAAARPNVGSTAQVVHALRVAGMDPEPLWGAISYLIDQQRSSGRWPNSFDDWSLTVPNREIRTVRCLHYATGWALLALHNLPDHATRSACARAAQFLIDTQERSNSAEPSGDDGSWQFEHYDPERYVWLTSQVVVALVAWRRHLRPAKFGTRPAREAIRSAFYRRGVWLVKHGSAIVLVGLAIGWLSGPIATAISRLLPVLDAAQVANNIAATAVWTTGSGLLLWFWRSMRRR